METRQVGERISFSLAHLGILASTIVFVLIPLAMTLQGGLLSPPRPGGFGQGFDTLARLISSSVLVSLLPAIIATVLSVSASACGLFVGWFRKFHVLWITVMLFTNPVFLVLGFSTLLVRLDSATSVVLATAYVVLPLGGLIMQSAFDHFPKGQIQAARALGAPAFTVIFSHLLPAVFPQALLACFLMSVYALGFYLLPTFVGFGEVVTLGTAINAMANRVGDWQASQQLACITLGLQIVLVGLWRLVVFATRSK